MRVGTIIALASVFGIAASGQQPSTSQTIYRPTVLPPVVIGAPFSAEWHRVRHHTLGDDTQITETWPVHKMYRDGQGRTRTERPLLDSPDAPEFPRIVELDDPAAGIEYVLEPKRRLAHRFTVGSGPAAEQDAATGESLGAWVIQGLRAEGQRLVTTIPAGVEHNDAPVVIITETWSAPDLKLVVRQKLTDPRLGESITELTGIRTAEPDPNLFQVPANYKVVDESGDFEIPVMIRSHASPPVLISTVLAKYTEQARDRGIQGTVQLTLFVDESGRAQGIRVEHSLDQGLDQEAVKAVRLWRFQPGERDGHAVRLPVSVDVTFSLDN